MAEWYTVGANGEIDDLNERFPSEYVAKRAAWKWLVAKDYTIEPVVFGHADPDDRPLYQQTRFWVCGHYTDMGTWREDRLPHRKPEPEPAPRGYTDCACRDCFDVAIDGGLCGLCADAGCEAHAETECSRADAYGAESEVG